jgi:hypothetical protein
MSKYEHLHGRVVALELMVRGFITELAMRHPDPASCVAGWRRDMLAVQQHVGWPFDEATDAIWAEAVTALNALFDAVETRVRSLKERYSCSQPWCVDRRSARAKASGSAVMRCFVKGRTPCCPTAIAIPSQRATKSEPPLSAGIGSLCRTACGHREWRPAWRSRMGGRPR